MEKGERMDVEKYLERCRKERCVICPYCETEHADSETLGSRDLITYHGSEDGPIEFECDHCEKEFFVYEEVERTYRSAKTVKQLDEV